MDKDPEVLWDWLKPPMATLAQRLASDQLPHALLITGQEGTGKRFFTRCLSQLLLCGKPGSLLACGECLRCGYVSARSHPDFRYCTLLVDKDKDKGGKPDTQIKVEAIRELNTWLGSSALMGRRKVAIIEPAATMNPNSANALLKSLEEPVPDTYIILVTHRPASLPATIRSRCFKVTLSNPDYDTARKFLQTRLGTGQSCDALLKASGGRPWQALQIAEGGLESLVKNVLRIWQGSDSPHQVSAALLKSEPDLITILDALDVLTAGVIRFLSGAVEAGLWLPISESSQNLLTRHVDRRQLGHWYLYRDELIKQRATALGTTNPNRPLILDKLLINWRYLGIRGGSAT